jgi:hypothetical protein
MKASTSSKEEDEDEKPESVQGLLKLRFQCWTVPPILLKYLKSCYLKA